MRSVLTACDIQTPDRDCGMLFALIAYDDSRTERGVSALTHTEPRGEQLN